MKPLVRHSLAILIGIALGWMVARFFIGSATTPIREGGGKDDSRSIVISGHRASEEDTAAAEQREWESYLEQMAPSATPSDLASVRGRLAQLAGLATRGNPVRAAVERQWLLGRAPTEILPDLLSEASEWPDADSAFEPWPGLFRRWAARDHLGALDALKKLTFNQRQIALQAVVSQWAEVDPLATLAYLESSKDDLVRTEGRKLALLALATNDPQLALAKAGKIGGTEARSVMADITMAWAGRDGPAALEWIARETPPDERETQLLHALMRWGQNQPQAAADYALTLSPGPQRAGALARIFQDWMFQDPSGAVAGLLALPDNPGNAEIIGSAARALAMPSGAGTAEALATADRFPKGPARDAYLAGLVKYGADNNIEFALQVVPLLPEGSQRQEALNHLAEVWAKKDAYKTAEWLNTLLPSPSTDAAIGHFANAAVELDPSTAVQWAASVENSQMRSLYLDTVFTKWRTKNPEAAEAWLHDTKSLSSQEKARLAK